MIRLFTLMSPLRLLKTGVVGFVLLMVKPFTNIKPPTLSKKANDVVVSWGVPVLYDMTTIKDVSSETGKRKNGASIVEYLTLISPFVIVSVPAVAPSGVGLCTWKMSAELVGSW